MSAHLRQAAKTLGRPIESLVGEYAAQQGAASLECPAHLLRAWDVFLELNESRNGDGDPIAQSEIGWWQHNYGEKLTGLEVMAIRRLDIARRERKPRD